MPEDLYEQAEEEALTSAVIGSCCECGENIYEEGEYGTVNRRFYCASCVLYNLRQCSECEEMGIISCMHYCENCDNWYHATCERCRCDNDNDPRDCGIAGHAYKPKPRFFGTPASPGDPYMGVELEVNSSNIKRDSEYIRNTMGDTRVYLKEDGSLTRGFEIVTHPHTLVAHRELWSEALFGKMPKSLSSYESGECGLHVHIDRKAMTPLQLGRMIVFMHSACNLPLLQTVAQRTIAGWCKIDLRKKLTTRYNNDRYESLNLQNEKTVEFRIFRGNLRRDRVLKAIEFCHAITLYCRDASNKALTAPMFLRWLSLPEQQAPYRNLINYLIDKRAMDGKITKGKSPNVAPEPSFAEA